MAVGQGDPGDPSGRFVDPGAARANVRIDKDKNGVKAVPTLAQPPAHWAAPVWLAGPAVALFVVSTRALPACVLSWFWASDSYTASIVTDRLLTGDGRAGADRFRNRSHRPQAAG